MTQAAARYEGAGWSAWPDHPEISLQFTRALGAAQEGAGTVSEALLAASRMTPGDPDSWHAEWQRLAQVNAQRAEAALASKHGQTAKGNFLRAAGYYRASQLMLAPYDPRRVATYRQVAANSQAYLELLMPAGEVVEMALGDGTFIDAYFLKPAAHAQRWPTVIAFGGLDGDKEELLQKMSKQALSRGLALLLIDMPGQGATLHLRGMANRVDTEVPVARCVDYLSTRDDVDGQRIALYGASMGGIYAARAASAERRLKAVVSDSLSFDLYPGMQRRLGQPPAQWAYLQWVFGCRTPEEVVEKSRQFGMAGFIGKIECPYLIVQGEHDFLGLQTAVDAFDFAKSQGVPVELKVFTGDETGASHCQADNPTLGQEFICDWLADRLGARPPI